MAGQLTGIKRQDWDEAGDFLRHERPNRKMHVRCCHRLLTRRGLNHFLARVYRVGDAGSTCRKVPPTHPLFPWS